MPHIIVEYPEQLLNDDQVEAILRAVHCAVADTGLFKRNRIRTRAYPFEIFTDAGEARPYIHVQARIKCGRDAESKKLLSDTILSAVNSLETGAEVISVEIIDMDRESHGIYVSG